MAPHNAGVKAAKATKATTVSPAKKKKKTVRKTVANKMTLFDARDDAVRACWEKILRFALIESRPIATGDHWRDSTEPHVVPGPGHSWAPGMAELGHRIYFTENTFHFCGGGCFDWWTSINKEAAKLLRKIGIDFSEHYILDWIPAGFGRCPGLQELSIGVNEPSMVQDFLRPANGFQRFNMRPQDVTPQLNLLVLRATHMDKLRQIRVPKMRFTPLVHGSRSNTTLARRTTGPIRGGVLERIVAREIMSSCATTPPIKITTTSPKRKATVESDGEYKPAKRTRQLTTRVIPGRAAKAQSNAHVAVSASMYMESDYESQSEPEPEPEPESGQGRGSEPEPEPMMALDLPVNAFRILDLPAEIRNQIYRHVLVQAGTINPSKRHPTTHHRAGTSLSMSLLYRRGDPPHSCLALLQMSKQVFHEAVGIFYGQNSFVFYFPNQLMMFLHSISEERKKYIERVTLWYKNNRQGDINSIDVNLAALQNLPNLKRLELLLDDHSISQLRDSHILGYRLAGEDMLKQMAEKVEVQVRGQNVDYFFWRRKRDSSYGSLDLAEYKGSWRAIRDFKKRIREQWQPDDLDSE